MKEIKSIRTINASLECVFSTVSDVRNFAKAVPHIAKIDFLSDQQTGVGTRFRETRENKGRQQAVELEVTEFAQNDRIRLVSDAGGTIWDTLFTVETAGDGTLLTMIMEVRPHNIFASIMNPFIRGMVVKGVESDMDSVKIYCESQ